MPTIIQFIFFYVVVPFGAVISLGIFSCLAKRDSIGTVKNARATDCLLTKIRTWLTLSALLIVGVFWFYKSPSIAADLLTSEIISGAYFLTFLILVVCATVSVAACLILGKAKKNISRFLSSSVLITMGVIAVFSTLFGSTFIIEFFKRAFLIGH